MTAHCVKPDSVKSDHVAIFCDGVEGHIAAVCKPQAPMFISRVVPVRLNPILKQHEVPLSFELGHVH